MILLDTNVLVAATLGGHPHHRESIELVGRLDSRSALIAAHSLAEAFSGLTRPKPYGWSGEEATAMIDSLAKRFTIVTLDAAQTLAALRRFAPIGRGPLFYDFLIGSTGEAFGADTVATWNIRDFVPLFPHLRVATPAELAA